MKWYYKILFLVFSPVLFYSCSKTDSPVTPPSPPPPPPAKTVSISNLVYTPDTIPIKFYSSTYTVTGTIDFADASGGVAKIRLTTSVGGDTTINVPGGGITSGRLTGIFEFIRPQTPARYSFQIWVIDVKGESSNKLGGTIDVIFDDRAVTWWPVLGETYTMNEVAWLNNQYIAVGKYSRIETSPNGANWTKQNTTDMNLMSLYGVTWQSGNYYAVGDRNCLLSSPNGINWTTKYMGEVTDGYLKSVASSGTRLVAVGSAYSFASDYPEILTSTDGNQWSANLFTVPNAGGVLRSVVWSGTQFVAVGRGRDADHDFLLILTSPDGINWTDRSIHSPWISLYDVIWTGTKFIAAGVNVIATSADGIVWQVNQVTGLVGVRGIVYSGKKYVAVGEGGVFVSDDAIHWSTPGTEPGLDYLNSIAWSPVNYNYIAVGYFFQPYIVSP